MAPFSSLSDELLLQIFGYLDPQRDDRILGHVDAEERWLPFLLSQREYLLVESFIKGSRTFRSLALTCRQFRMPAIEQLLHAPCVSGFALAPTRTSAAISPRFICLLRTLLKRREYGLHIKSLQFTVFLLDGDLQPRIPDPEIRDEIARMRYLGETYKIDQLLAMLESFNSSGSIPVA